ncbi:MAG: HDIG domain-containing protein [Acidimicrobiia bacterium]|nr:HDIG domain-containing protein [Acidimicrobiia bacterium]
MRLGARTSGAVRAVVLAMTVVFVALVLVAGQGEEVEVVTLREGQPAPETLIATGDVEVVDETATEAARQAAGREVEEVYTPDAAAGAAALRSIQDFFANVDEAAAPLEIPDDDPGVVPTVTTTPTTAAETTTSEATSTSEGETTTSEATTTSEETTTSTSTSTTTTLPPPPPEEVQIAQLRQEHPLLRPETLQVMVAVRNDDLERVAAGEGEIFPLVETEALTLANTYLGNGIRSGELEQVRNSLVSDPPTLILLRDLPDEQRLAAEAGVADLVATSLQPNSFPDDAATQFAREQAMAAVEDFTVSYVAGENIVTAGERVSAVQLQAINELGLLVPEESGPSLPAMALVATLVVLLAVFYLWRVAREYWQQPKMVALFGLLLILAAAVSRLPGLLTRDRVDLGFLIPAALLGYLAASLFDSRTAVVLAVPAGAFTALATESAPLVIFAVGATLAPIPLVSAVSSRTELNLAVALSAALHAPLAVALAWFFYPEVSLGWAALFGLASGLISGVAALGLLPFLASTFGITTTQTLLDLTDRNHPALRLIEEEAPGTFNHSIMVGSLAGKAARAVGGNPLLAQAMAYFHDLGKTVAPQYFVENQFGVSNPHDQLPPEHSAAVVRSHVAEGLRLSRELGLPADVTQGIVTHHGTSLMRYFYHRALELYGEDQVDPSDYRHRGRKPSSKEMVVLMMADSCEAAARALVQHEDPTSESLRRLVEQVISEKVEDGQLEESEVTFGELTRIKETIVDGLIGYYHARIPYPGFPGKAVPAS